MATEGPLTLTIAGESVALLPQRAIHWPARKTLILADPHIGKADTFRRAGVPVPAAVAEHDFDRLTQLLQDYTPDRFVILGDFLHARPDEADHSMDLLRRWREAHREVDILLVRGNHDKHAGNPDPSLGFTVVDEPYADGPFIYRHFPIKSKPDAQAKGPAPYTLAGHLHPGVTLKLDRLHARRVPCFHLTATQAILPAFGRFTGTARIHPNTPGKLYAIGQNRVIPVPNTVLA